jgi:cytochrome c oxidase subunit 2
LDWRALELGKAQKAQGECCLSDIVSQGKILVQSSLSLLPDRMSTFAHYTDDLFLFILVLCVIFFVAIVGTMTWFIIKYRRRSDNESTPVIKGNHTLEIIWSVIPGLLFVVIFAWGFVGWAQLNVVPPDALNIRVTGAKWNWSFTYPDGITSGELVVPANKPVKLTMSSKDVIHSFYIPDFRIKRDVIPGRYTVIWFETFGPAEHYVLCTEYCGTSHSQMMAKVRVVPQQEYDEWIASGGGMGDNVPLAELGSLLFQQRGCVACHSLDGSKLVGPTLKGAFGREVELTDGTKVEADENYIRSSILNPGSQIVSGYPAVMPSFQGQLSDKQIDALIEYIKSLAQ